MLQEHVGEYLLVAVVDFLAAAALAIDDNYDREFKSKELIFQHSILRSVQMSEA